MNYSFCPPPNLYPEHMPEMRADSGPPRLIIAVCNHILESGRPCQCAARHGQRFCRHHIDLRVRRLRTGRAERLIRLGFRMPRLEDMPAVQLARARVRYAVDAGHMDPSMVPLMSWALRQASGNIRFMEEQARREKHEAVLAASKPDAEDVLSPIHSIKYEQPIKTQIFVGRTVVSS